MEEKELTMKKNPPDVFTVPEGTEQVSCNGDGVLGHPKVWYTFDGRSKVVCHYCERTFVKEPQAKAG